MVHDWWISIHFVCFCFSMTVTIMIDGIVKRIISLDLNFRVRILLKSAINNFVTLTSYNFHFRRRLSGNLNATCLFPALITSFFAR